LDQPASHTISVSTQLTYITAYPSVCDSGISTSRLASCMWGRAAGVGGIPKGSEGMSECQQKKTLFE